MVLLNSVTIVLSSIGTHLLIPLLAGFTVSILIGLAGLSFVKGSHRRRRVIALQNLKAEANELKERLLATQAMTAALPVKLSGPGPFQLSPITDLSWLVPTKENGVRAGFVLQDGNRIHATLSNRTLAQLVNDNGAGPLQKQTLFPATSIDLQTRADAYELPFFPRLEGHFDRGRHLRILAFSSADRRIFLFPLSLEIYEQLRMQSKTILGSSRAEDTLHKAISLSHW